MSENYIAVCSLDNEIEARIVEEILEENDIPYILKESDSVSLPVYDLTEGFATIYAEEEYAEEVRLLIEELRAASFDADALYDEDGEAEEVE